MVERTTKFTSDQFTGANRMPQGLLQLLGTHGNTADAPEHVFVDRQGVGASPAVRERVCSTCGAVLVQTHQGDLPKIALGHDDNAVGCAARTEEAMPKGRSLSCVSVLSQPLVARLSRTSNLSMPMPLSLMVITRVALPQMMAILVACARRAF